MFTPRTTEAKQSAFAVTGALLCTILCLGVAVAPAARAAGPAVAQIDAVAAPAML